MLVLPSQNYVIQVGEAKVERSGGGRSGCKGGWRANAKRSPPAERQSWTTPCDRRNAAVQATKEPGLADAPGQPGAGLPANRVKGIEEVHLDQHAITDNIIAVGPLPGCMDGGTTAQQLGNQAAKRFCKGGGRHRKPGFLGILWNWGGRHRNPESLGILWNWVVGGIGSPDLGGFCGTWWLGSPDLWGSNWVVAGRIFGDLVELGGGGSCGGWWEP